MRKHQRAVVIQQQPIVIDWSICLCVAYKWATWYSALFIWNQLRQRCCVSACCMRALSLRRLLIPCLRRRDSGQEKARWGREREASAGGGKKGSVCVRLCGKWVRGEWMAGRGHPHVFNSLFNRIRRALAQHMHTYNKSSCQCKVPSGILIERRVLVHLQHCWFQSAVSPWSPLPSFVSAPADAAKVKVPSRPRKVSMLARTASQPPVIPVRCPSSQHLCKM